MAFYSNDGDFVHISNFMSELKTFNKHQIVVGGIQQLINRKLKGNEDISYGDPQLSSLPVPIQLHILSYITPCDLCRMSRVNSYWNELCNDDILWAQMIKRDMHKWRRIGHLTHPDIYEDVESDWSKKQIYLKCCPETNQMMRNEHYMFHQLSSLLRSVLTPRFYHKPIKVIMFGPGLRKPTSQIFNKMINSDRFHVIGVAPSEFQGIGSGLYVTVNNSYTINLMVLYPGPRSVRDGPAVAAGAVEHKLFTATLDENGQGGVSASIRGGEWTSQVQQLAATVNAAIFIINTHRDSVTDIDNSNATKQQLHSMLRGRGVGEDVPVSVLCCSPDGDTETQVSCVDTCRRLGIKHLNRPWMVSNHCSTDDDLTTVFTSIDWLIQQTMRT